MHHAAFYPFRRTFAAGNVRVVALRKYDEPKDLARAERKNDTAPNQVVRAPRVQTKPNEELYISPAVLICVQRILNQDAVRVTALVAIR